MRKALIFGVAGQDGSFLAEQLLNKDYKVYGTKRRSSNNFGRSRLTKETLSNPNFNLVTNDITDSHAVFSIIRDIAPDYIYNLAAQSHVGTSFLEASSSIDVTMKGCLNILEAVRMTGGTSRVYQASSSEMFGNSGEKIQDETTPFKPCSPYAIAKVGAHNLVDMYRRAYGIHACSGILFNHESERRGFEFVTRKITRYLAHLYYHLTNDSRFCSIDKLRLGNINSVRDWGYAPDYTEAMQLILEAKCPKDYVVATGVTNSITNFLLFAVTQICILSRCDIGGDDIYHNYIEISEDYKRPCDVVYLKGNSSKISTELGWYPKHGFFDIIRIMLSHDIKELGEYGPDAIQQN